MEHIFDIRQRIARIGSSDWFGWWESKSLTSAGAYALARIFRRTTELTAADLAIRSARIRHDRSVPSEPLIHLFNFGEEFEGAFARWMIDRKAEGWMPNKLPDEPPDGSAQSVRAAVQAVQVEPRGEASWKREGRGLIFLGRLEPDELDDLSKLHGHATKLAGAYTAAKDDEFVVPFFRVGG